MLSNCVIISSILFIIVHVLLEVTNNLYMKLIHDCGIIHYNIIELA